MAILTKSSNFTDSFLVTEENAEATEFQLSFAELSPKNVTVEVLNEDGVWTAKTENTD